MAIIYTYPVKTTPVDADLILISDSADNNATKQVTVSSVKALTAGVSKIVAGTNVTISPTSGLGDVTINSSGGGTPTQPGNPSASIQYNDGAGAFAGSANLTFATNTLTLTDTLDIKGDGTNPGTLKLYCEDTTTPHAVSILGPVHSGATPYSIRLPKEIATQTVYSSGGRVLESDASGALQWIVTPTGGGGNVNQVTAGGVIPASSGAPLIVTPSTGNVVVTSARYNGGSNEGHVPLGGSNTTFLRGDATWATPTGGISFSGSTANGIATYSSSTTANVSSVFTVSGNKLSAPAGTEADPSVEVGAVGGLYAASGGIFLTHSGASAIGVNSSSIVNYKLTQFNAGLKFGVSGSTLNKYEEGTWTPTAYAAVGSAPTVSSSNGTYTIIGDICHITFKIVVTGSSSQNVSMTVGGIPAAATADNDAGEKSAGQLFVNSDSNEPQAYPSIFIIQNTLLTMIVQGGSKNSYQNQLIPNGSTTYATPYGLKAGDYTASWYRPSGGTGITLEGSATYKLA